MSKANFSLLNILNFDFIILFLQKNSLKGFVEKDTRTFKKLCC